jgi:hypothetical protein
MEDERISQKVLNWKFNVTRLLGKPRARWKGVIWRDTSHPRNKRMEETNRKQRRIGASSEGGQGPEGAAAPYLDG